MITVLGGEGPPDRLKDFVERIVRLYESWAAAEPEKGYDTIAAEWRAKLDAFNGEQGKQK